MIIKLGDMISWDMSPEIYEVTKIDKNKVMELKCIIDPNRPQNIGQKYQSYNYGFFHIKDYVGINIINMKKKNHLPKWF